MIRIFTLFALCSIFSFQARAQNLALEVYDILQTNCATSGCHNSTDQAANLDLEGTGTNPASVVFNNLINKQPTNTYARNSDFQLVYPGRPDKSFLFRKINQGLEELVNLHEDEKADMPLNADPISEIEREKIRQWIIYGASTIGDPQVDGIRVSDLVEDYYSQNGLEAFPDGPPPAPAEGEGFQIKMGPFFLPPNGEEEYFHKYDLDLPSDVEVNRIDMSMSNFSHHLILYDFNPGGANSIPDGLRLNPNHSDIGLVTAIQQSEDLRLPEGTAFRWEESIVLDLNSHYINYTATQVYKCESYINVYTQPTGTAAQEMKTELVANFNIFIPNNGNMINSTDIINYPLGDIYLWGLMGHTHQYGRGYKVYKRDLFEQGEIIYDAACPQGIPGCVSPNFDYQHIPLRRYDSFLPVRMNFSNGLVHEASWVNNGPTGVSFGPTSDDEMMVLILMYVEDLEGVTVSSDQVRHQVKGVKISPNPMTDISTISIPKAFEANQLFLYDVTGKQVLNKPVTSDYVEMHKGNLLPGMYFYRLEDEQGQYATGKLVIN